MKRAGIAALAALGLVGVFAPSAGATTYGPCAAQQALFDKYGIGLNMHQEQLEEAYGTVCRITG